MFKGMGSDFVMIEGEGILRVRKKTRLSEGKIKICDVNEKEKNRIKQNKRPGWKGNRRKTKRREKMANMAELKFESKKNE